MTTARTNLIVATLVFAFGATPVLGQQVDLAGLWSATLGNHEELPLRGDPGVEVDEYVGIPLNDAARQHAARSASGIGMRKGARLPGEPEERP